MAKQVQLKERGTNELMYPITNSNSVVVDDSTLNSKLTSIENNINEVGEYATNSMTEHLNTKIHVPSGGLNHQVLSIKGANQVAWSEITDILPNVEEYLAYGVRWYPNQQDPHVTRIGNLNFHRTLPIQSQLKGCITQKGKIIYWLNENDWRFKQVPELVTASEVKTETNIVIHNHEVSVGQYIKDLTNEAIGQITLVTKTSQEGIGQVRNITIEWIGTEEASGSLNFELGSNLTGYDGTLKVYCPEFYIKSYENRYSLYNEVWISTFKIDDSWEYQPACLIDASHSTVYQSSDSASGYLSTLSDMSAVCVVNNAEYVRGGDGSTNSNPFKNTLGKPKTNQPIQTFRTWCINSEEHQMLYSEYKNIFYWLYVIEYANFNCQETYNEELTTDGFKQGGLGSGVTSLNSSTTDRAYNQPIVSCGCGIEYGNKTAVISITDGTKTFNVPRWRGFVNPFGGIETALDGILCIKVDNTLNIYTCSDPTKCSNAVTSDYQLISTITNISASGYIKEFNIGSNAHIIPSDASPTTGASSYKCDFFIIPTSNDTSVATIGGASDSLNFAGIGNLNLFYIGVNNIKNSLNGFRSVSYIKS